MVTVIELWPRWRLMCSGWAPAAIISAAAVWRRSWIRRSSGTWAATAGCQMRFREVGVPQRRAGVDELGLVEPAGGGEDEGVGSGLDVFGEVRVEHVPQGAGEGDGAGAVALGRSVHERAIDLCDGLGDVDTGPEDVDPPAA